METILKRLKESAYHYEIAYLLEYLEDEFPIGKQRVETLVKIINLFHLNGRYEDQDQLTQVGFQWMNALPETPDNLFIRSQLLRHQGIQLKKLNLLDQAEALFTEEWNVLKKLPHVRKEGVLHQLATIYRKQLKFKQAYQHNMMALEAGQHTGSHFSIATSYNNLGSLYNNLSVFEDAIEAYKSGLTWVKGDQDYIVYEAVITYNIGECYLRLNQLDEAESYAQEAIRLFRIVNSTFYSIFVDLIEAELAFAKKHYAIAEAYTRTVLAACQRKRILGEALHKGALLLLKTLAKQGKRKEAIQIAEQYEPNFRSNCDLLTLNQFLLVLFDLYKTDQDIEGFRKIAIETVQSQEKVQQLKLSFANFKSKIQYDYKLKERELAYEKATGKLTKELNNNLLLKNKELNQFAGRAAHDLKAPIRTIQAFSKILEKKLSDQPATEESITFIQSASQQMLDLIDSFLQYAKFGDFQESSNPVSLNEVLETVLRQIQFHIQETSALIYIEALPTVQGIQVPLVQLFQNIITNAIKFTKPGITPQVHIRTQTFDSSYMVSVSDNGIGIPDEQLDVIFEPLTKLHAKDRFTGSGMGLATCRLIMNHFGGQIWAQSKLDHGTTIYLEFPKSI
ncbi:MAG: ATP-binding protein [Bacteroidota bacterium]